MSVLARLSGQTVRVLEAAAGLGVPLPVGAATKGVFQACMESGRGDEDMSTIIKLSEERAGTTVAK